MSTALQRSSTDKDHELVAAKAAASIAEGKLQSLLEELSNAKHTSEAASTTSGFVLKVCLWACDGMHVASSGSPADETCDLTATRVARQPGHTSHTPPACCYCCLCPSLSPLPQALTKQVTDTVSLQAQIEAQQSTIDSLQQELSDLMQLHSSKEQLVSTLQDGNTRLREQLELEQALRKQADKASEVRHHL
jgi:hypothetical protein